MAPSMLQDHRLAAAAVLATVSAAAAALACTLSYRHDGDDDAADEATATDCADVEPCQRAMWRAQSRRIAMQKPHKTSDATGSYSAESLGFAPGPSTIVDALSPAKPQPAAAASSPPPAAAASSPPPAAVATAEASSSPPPAAAAAAASSPPPATTGVALVVSPTAEAEAAVDDLLSGAMVPDSVRTVDLFEDAETQQEYRHGTPAPAARDELADLDGPPSAVAVDDLATLDGLSLPPYQPSPAADPAALLNASSSTMNDSSFTAGAKMSFLDGIISGSDDEDEGANDEAQAGQTLANQSEVADAEDAQDTAADNPAASPSPADASFEWPPSNGWGTPAPVEQSRPHLGGTTPKPLGAESEQSSTDVKQILQERGAAIDAAVEASAAGKFRNVAEVLASSTTNAEFRQVLAAVQEQQKLKESELRRRQQALQALQHQQKARAQASGDFQNQLASMLGEARSKAAGRVAVAETAFRDLPEFGEEDESDDEEYRPSAQELAADAADAAANGLKGAVPEKPPRRAPVVGQLPAQPKPASSTAGNPGGRRPNKKKARKKAKNATVIATAVSGKENAVTMTTSTGKSVKAGGKRRARKQPRAAKAQN
jgi:hypothetical protein